MSSVIEHSHIAIGHLTNHDDGTLWYIASYVGVAQLNFELDISLVPKTQVLRTVSSQLCISFVDF